MDIDFNRARRTVTAATVDLSAVAGRDRLKRGKIYDGSAVRTVTIEETTATYLDAGQRATEWANSVLDQGTGNQACDVLASNGRNRHLLARQRDAEEILAAGHQDTDRSSDDYLHALGHHLTDWRIGDCGEHADLTYLYLSALVEAGLLPPDTHVMRILHPTMIHSLVYVGAKADFQEGNWHKIVAVDPWLVVAQATTTDRVHKGMAFDPTWFSPQGLAALRQKRTAPLIYRHFSSRSARQNFPSTVAAIDRKVKQRAALPESAAAVRGFHQKEVGGGNSPLFSGRDWPVRKSTKVVYRIEKRDALLDMNQHDFNRYFDRQTALLMVEELGLTSAASGIDRQLRRNQVDFHAMLAQLTQGDAGPLHRFLHTLPPLTARTLAFDLIALGNAHMPERQRAMGHWIRHCLNEEIVATSPGSTDMLGDTLLPGCVAHDGIDLALLPTILDAFKDRGDRLTAAQRASLARWHDGLDPLCQDVCALLVDDATRSGWHWSTPPAAPVKEQLMAASIKQGKTRIIEFLASQHPIEDAFLLQERWIAEAATEKDWSMVWTLLTLGFAPPRPLHEFLGTVIKSDHDKIVQRILDTQDLNLREEDGNPPLHRAIRSKDDAVLDALLCADSIDVNALDANGNSALLLAIEARDENVLDLLLSRDDLDINQVCNGLTALNYAIESGNAEAVAALIDDPRVNWTARDRSGRTPFDVQPPARGRRGAFIREQLAKTLSEMHQRDSTSSNESGSDEEASDD
jgi:hypothetical protein